MAKGMRPWPAESLEVKKLTDAFTTKHGKRLFNF